MTDSLRNSPSVIADTSGMPRVQAFLTAIATQARELRALSCDDVTRTTLDAYASGLEEAIDELSHCDCSHDEGYCIERLRQRAELLDAIAATHIGTPHFGAHHGRAQALHHVAKQITGLLTKYMH